MKKLLITIVLFAWLIQLNAQNSLQNKIDSLEFPRLCKTNYYSPSNFKSGYLTDFGIDIGSDSNNTALIGSLRIYDMVISSELGYKFQYLKDSLNPNLILFHNWNTVGAFLQEISYPTFPNKPKWFSSLLISSLADTAYVGDTIITVKSGEGGKFLLSFIDSVNNRKWNWNDNIFIEDIANPDSSKMILIDTTSSNHLHIKKSAHYYYDFSKIKHNHLPDSKVWIVHCPVWSDWWGYNISSVCPKVKVGNDSIKFNEHIARVIAQSYKDFNAQQNLIAGIWLDTYNDYYVGPYCDFGDAVNSYIDMDLNGIPDLKENHTIGWINQKWTEGHTELTMHLRNYIGPNVPIVLNDGGINSIQYVNGIHYEKLPELVWDTTMGSNPILREQWLAALQQYTAQMTCSSCPSPRICQIQGTQSNGSFTLYDFKKMRKSLTFTLMNDGYFYYSDWYQLFHTFWWFDEYTVDSTGSSVTLANGNPVDRVDPTQMDEALFQKLKKAKGYLGFPLGKYQSLSDGVLRRDFDYGVVFCNLSPYDFNISISDTLKRIKGKQDTVANNGAPVIGSFLLPKNDGIILLRNNKLTGIGSEGNLPVRFALYQNYPNPFNSSTKIKYSIPNSAKVSIKVYDVLGKEVTTLMNEFQNTGTHEIEFDASKLSSGLYFYRIISGIYSETRKMILLR